MDFYRFCFYLGFTGIASMALLGMSHMVQGLGHGSIGSHGTGAHGAGAHSHGGSGDGAHSHGHGHSGHGHGRGHSRGEGQGSEPVSWRLGNGALAMLSPRFLFSTMLGLGATGILIHHTLPTEPLRLIASVCGGLVFERFLVGPVWNFAFRFASQPAHTLETAVAEEAKAVTNFDANGEGLIAVELDGQVVQLLGRLTPEARQSAKRVRSGDRLFVESVDGKRNQCTVSPLEIRALD